jgi:hypothetical protein
MMLQVVGLLAALALLALLVSREVLRVASPDVGGTHRPRLAGRTVSLRVELALWVVAAAILFPRVFDLLT